MVPVDSQSYSSFPMSEINFDQEVKPLDGLYHEVNGGRN